jgi:hypothetical protein
MPNIEPFCAECGAEVTEFELKQYACHVCKVYFCKAHGLWHWHEELTASTIKDEDDYHEYRKMGN